MWQRPPVHSGQRRGLWSSIRLPKEFLGRRETLAWKPVALARNSAYLLQATAAGHSLLLDASIVIVQRRLSVLGQDCARQSSCTVGQESLVSLRGKAGHSGRAFDFPCGRAFVQFASLSGVARCYSRGALRLIMQSHIVRREIAPPAALRIPRIVH